MTLAQNARLLEEQKTVRRVYEIKRDIALRANDSVIARHRPLDLRRLSRRAFVVAAAVTVAATQAFADTPFTSFAFSGTGSPTSRTMPARIADIFNILDFGADPTEVADSQPAIQAAITAASNSGIIFGPKGSYKALSSVLVPAGSGLQFIGEGTGTNIVGNFNGFIFDNLSSPYNPVGAPSSIESWGIQNSFTGNNFPITANGTWSASGSPVNITLSGANPGVAAGGALWVRGGGLGKNSVFIGMITSVASWPTVTVASAAVGSGATSNLPVSILQCYAAGGSFVAGAATITMAATRPAGIGTGLYYVYDYENYLADPRYDFPIGVGSWGTGTTFTFVPGYSGSLQNSVGSSDRLWFAPVAGCIRYSSVVGATVRNCSLSGFICLTTSQDKIVPNDPTVGAAEGFHVVADTNTLSNPSGFSGLLGQTGIYFQNNSISINSNHNSMWVAERLSGTACGIIGGRAEVCYFGIIIGGDFTASNSSLTAGFIEGRSMESNLQALYCKGGNASIKSTGCSCDVSFQALGGFYLNAFSGTLDTIGIVGHFGSGNGLYIADPGNNRGNIKITSTNSIHTDTPSLSWRIPTQAWWGACEQSNNPALVYAFSGLPTGSSSPTPFEGETYDITDCNTSTFLATAAAGGTGATAHRRVRWNAVSSLWQVNG